MPDFEWFYDHIRSCYKFSMVTLRADRDAAKQTRKRPSMINTENLVALLGELQVKSANGLHILRFMVSHGVLIIFEITMLP